MNSILGHLGLLAFLSGALLVESIATCQFIVPDRIKRAATGMNRLLLLIPVLAALVFAVLFLFVLKGRFYERLCHATLVLSLWLYAARYCWFLLAYHKCFTLLSSVEIHLFFIIGLSGAAMALTPLDSYSETIYPVLGSASILPGAVLLLVFYIAAFFTTCANKTQASDPLNWPSWCIKLGEVALILILLAYAVYRLVWRF